MLGWSYWRRHDISHKETLFSFSVPKAILFIATYSGTNEVNPFIYLI